MSSDPCSVLDGLIFEAYICAEREQRPDLVVAAILRLAELAGLNVAIRDDDQRGEELSMTPTERIDVAIGHIISALRDPEATMDELAAVHRLAGALHVGVVPVPLGGLDRLDRLADIWSASVETMGRRQPDQRKALIDRMVSRCHEFRDVIESWMDDPANSADGRQAGEMASLAKWTLAPGFENATT